jgi:hypothetical protein
MDHIEKAGMKKQRKKRMHCSICQKFNHTTKNGYKNNLNQSLLMAENKDEGSVVADQVGEV